MPTTIDCHYLGLPQIAAAYLITDGDRAVLIENNTATAVPRLLGALEDAGVKPEQVDYVIVTHIHLDHAGGTGALLAACRRATVLAHPRAERHLVDPTRLSDGAKKVYGEAEFLRIYGEIMPIPAERVRPMEHESELQWGRRTFRFLHTRGHAKHHFCVVDGKEETIYTGDAFGLVYPRLQHHGLCALPSTTPTDFHPQDARTAIRTILDSGATCALPTHFGPVAGGREGMEQVAAQLVDHLEVAEGIMREAHSADATGQDLVAFCFDRLEAHVRRCDEKQGLALSRDDLEFLRRDLQLNAQGIAHAIEKARSPA